MLISKSRQIRNRMRQPQVRRMCWHEVWQHTFLMVSFIVLVLSGFALRFTDSWITKFFFGWEQGFELRGTIHRVAAVVLMFTALWHTIYLRTRRGRAFFMDMLPRWSDFKDFGWRILYNLGRHDEEPRYKRFSYIEKFEYWALIWGTALMIVTGLFLWFDNLIVEFLPKGVLDVSLVIHYYEAILATLAILIWHLYSTVFDPRVYPMNPSWLNGKMPKEMFDHEHEADEPEQMKA